MSSNKERYMKILCNDLSDKDLKLLTETIRAKIVKGSTPEEIAQQLLVSIAQTIIIGSPKLTDEEIVDIAEDIGSAIIDRVMQNFGISSDQEGVPPREYLN